MSIELSGLIYGPLMNARISTPSKHISKKCDNGPASSARSSPTDTRDVFLISHHGDFVVKDIQVVSFLRYGLVYANPFKHTTAYDQ